MIPDDLQHTEAEARHRLLSDLRYDVALDLSGGPDASAFRSVTEIDFSATAGADTFIDLEAETIHEIVLNGEAVDAASAFADNRVALAGLRASNHLRVVADQPYSHTGMGLHRVIDPADGHLYIYTQCEPYEAHRVFAAFDQPDLKARFTMRVIAPTEWVVVGNSPVARIDADASDPATSTVVFTESPLMSTYLVAVVAGPYARVTDTHDGVELNLYCRQSLRRYLDDQEIFEITKQGLDHFAERFGMRYPFGDKYDQLFVPEFNAGAMENVACVTFNEESAIYRGAVPASVRSWRAGTILHEMAHMWFGDLVTMRWWNDLWLNESFATYMGNDAQATATRFTSAWVDFANGDKSWAARQDQLPTTHPIAADVPNVSTGRLNFDGISYAKGASVLRQLVAWVGEESFFGGIREYFTEHQWSNATLRDFLAPLERHSGRDLAAWSREWLETAGMNVLRAEIAATDGIIESCAVLQAPATPASADAALTPHRRRALRPRRPRPAGAHRAHRARHQRCAHRGAGSSAGGRGRRLLLLNDGDLTFAKIRLDEVSIQTVIDHLSDLEDPLARSLLWAAMWDMARDADIPAGRYIDFVHRHAPNESLPTIVDDLLSQAIGAVENFTDPGNRRAARAHLHETAATILAAATPGSPVQLSALRCTLATSDAPEDFDFAAGLLAGRFVPDGITIDQDLRWLITRRLAAAGRLDNAAIDAEAARDNTDLGARKAAAARASRPHADAKASAWARIIDRATTLAMQRALIGGIQERDQQELLEPYIGKWAEQVPRYWRERASEEAEVFTQGMYPAYRADDAVIAAADRLLEGERARPTPAAAWWSRAATARFASSVPRPPTAPPGWAQQA